MRNIESIEVQLRYRIIGQLHTGRLRPGDRLPSIRELSRQLGTDHRLIAEAYRGLEREGVVEIRPGSGVFAATQEEVGGVSSERARWLGRILHEGWLRHLSRKELGELITRSASTSLRCGVIESNTDHLVAFCAEMEESFALDTAPLKVPPDAGIEEVSLDDLAGVDLVVTSIFHAELAREMVGRLDLPLVVLTINPEFTAEIGRRLRERPLTGVMVDPEYAIRAEKFLGVTAHRGRSRFVLLSDLDRETFDPEREDVLLTRAARRELGLQAFHLIPPPPDLISSEAAHDLLMEITRLSLSRSA